MPALMTYINRTHLSLMTNERTMSQFESHYEL